MLSWAGICVAIVLASTSLGVSVFGLYQRTEPSVSHETDASKSEPGLYTKAVVAKAIRRYESEGRAATISYYNTAESVDGAWYVFIVDEDDTVVAHATAPHEVGEDLKGLLGKDIFGYDFGADIIAATSRGRWVDYTYLNPARRNQEETKHIWVVRHDGLLFGSGWYERTSRDRAISKADPAEYTRAYVENAIDMYQTDGRTRTIEYYSTLESVDGEWYLFIIGEDDQVIAHGTLPQNVGLDLRGPLGTDVNGYVFGPNMLAATEQGKWVDYTYRNPAHDDRLETKHAWVVKHDGLIFGSGWYEVTSITNFVSPPRF